MKTNFGIDSGFKLVNTTISDEDFIFSNGENFIIYDLETVVLVETITDLLDFYNIVSKEDRLFYIKEITEYIKRG